MSDYPSRSRLDRQIRHLDLTSTVSAELCAEALLLGEDYMARWHAHRYAARDALRVEYRQQRRDLARLAVTA